MTHRCSISARPVKSGVRAGSIRGTGIRNCGPGPAATGVASWSAPVRMANSSRCSAGLGSSPSSSTKVLRTAWKVANASACRPDRYSALINWPAGRSRSGYSATRARISPITSWCRPRSSSASMHSSSTSTRRSAIRTSFARTTSLSTSQSGSPRHRASAARNAVRAACGSRATPAARPRATRSAKTCRSSSPGARSMRVAGALHPDALAEPGPGQRPAQYRHGGLHLGPGGGGRRLAPHRVDHRLQRHHLVGAEQQQRQHDALPARRHGDRLIALHLQRPEDPEAERSALVVFLPDQLIHLPHSAVLRRRRFGVSGCGGVRARASDQHLDRRRVAEEGGGACGQAVRAGLEDHDQVAGLGPWERARRRRAGRAGCTGSRRR